MEHKFSHIQVKSSRAFSAFTTLCNHQLYLVPKYFLFLIFFFIYFTFILFFVFLLFSWANPSAYGGSQLGVELEL